MKSPHGLDLSDNCQTCSFRATGFFCQLSAGAIRELDMMKYISSYPRGALLFGEQQVPTAMHLLCHGEVKLSVNSSSGRTFVLKVANSGEALGLRAVLSGSLYEVTAETLRPSQVAVIPRDRFLRFLAKYSEAYKAVTQQLMSDYGEACEQLRTVGLATPVTNRLAKLLLEWSSRGQKTRSGIRITLNMTHAEIADCIGTSRESVTRALTDFRNRHLIDHQGSTVTISNRAALMSLVTV